VFQHDGDDRVGHDLLVGACTEAGGEGVILIDPHFAETLRVESDHIFNDLEGAKLTKEPLKAEGGLLEGVEGLGDAHFPECLKLEWAMLHKYNELDNVWSLHMAGLEAHKLDLGNWKISVVSPLVNF
jgi:hypothetical protein